ncbi:MAG: hypothetical protein QM765_35490 [Myxococcales bacterium]
MSDSKEPGVLTSLLEGPVRPAGATEALAQLDSELLFYLAGALAGVVRALERGLAAKTAIGVGALARDAGVQAMQSLAAYWLTAIVATWMLKRMTLTTLAPNPEAMPARVRAALTAPMLLSVAASFVLFGLWAMKGTGGPGLLALGVSLAYAVWHVWAMVRGLQWATGFTWWRAAGVMVVAGLAYAAFILGAALAVSRFRS